MSIVKCKSYIDVYEAKARSRDGHELSGRTGRPDLTLFVSKSIASHLSLTPSDTVVDVGCGDGSLIRLLSKTVSKVVGVLPTNAEVERVESLLQDIPNCKIVQGMAQLTGLPSRTAESVVCNGVLILLPDTDIRVSLQELARICKSNGHVFVGEVPDVSEQEERKYGDSVSLWLWWVLRNQGLKQLICRLRQVVVASFTREPFIIAPKIHFFADPEDIARMARDCGLIERGRFRHREITDAGEVYESKTRWDFLFEKIEST